jgi:putative sterol carrier protein
MQRNIMLRRSARGGSVIESKRAEAKMVAVQLTTDEGAFICNIDQSDVTKAAARESGAFIVIHHAIRLDAMLGGQYEIYKTKVIETSAIDFFQSFTKKSRCIIRKEPAHPPFRSRS